MKYGDRGANVIALQRALQREGLLPPNTNSARHDDGIFGKGTEAAVKKYQAKLGVAENGIVGNYFAQRIGIVLTPKPVIVLTAGHNSIKDFGAVSKDKSWTEAQIVTDLRNRVKVILEQNGYVVVTDGDGENNLPLNQAVKLVPVGDVAIELHLNASDNSQANGIEALAHSKWKKVCSVLCQSISDDMGYKIRGSNGGWKASNSGQHSRLAYADAGGIILELFFISNQSELESYVSNPENLAKAIANAIMKI